ncbi:hypothetical protein TNIN_175291 [Trichonephila inaurata madagascariensis]|uniref:Uncharacterized protein n=1 Tax=Trichonephila inaurata madagascariensis TaxID=2747483 RepID=A0A8X6XG16_9ARAC|nr:hypothetical protein TNIN_175291 [Trichonephila inaurata madagascariensis]
MDYIIFISERKIDEPLNQESQNVLEAEIASQLFKMTMNNSHESRIPKDKIPHEIHTFSFLHVFINDSKTDYLHSLHKWISNKELKSKSVVSPPSTLATVSA